MAYLHMYAVVHIVVYAGASGCVCGCACVLKVMRKMLNDELSCICLHNYQDFIVLLVLYLFLLTLLFLNCALWAHIRCIFTCKAKGNIILKACFIGQAEELRIYKNFNSVSQLYSMQIK